MAVAGLNPAGRSSRDVAQGAVGVAVGEDLPVGVEDAVAVSVRRGHRRSDGRGLGSRRTEVRRVAEGVDVARLSHQPVAVATGVGHDCDRGARAAPDAGAAPGEVGVAEGEDPAVGGHHEVATLVVARHHARRSGR